MRSAPQCSRAKVLPTGWTPRCGSTLSGRSKSSNGAACSPSYFTPAALGSSALTTTSTPGGCASPFPRTGACDVATLKLVKWLHRSVAEMEVGVRELRNNLSRYLDRVRDGE